MRRHQGASGVVALLACSAAVLVLVVVVGTGGGGGGAVELGERTQRDISRLKAYVAKVHEAKAKTQSLQDVVVHKHNLLPLGRHYSQQPTGFIVQPAKYIHGILDVAAPVDSGTEATVPGIIKPEEGVPFPQTSTYGYQYYKQPQEQQLAVEAAHAAAKAGYVQQDSPTQELASSGPHQEQQEHGQGVREQKLSQTWQLSPQGTRIVVPPPMVAQDPRAIPAPLPMLPPPLQHAPPAVYPLARTAYPQPSPMAPAVAYPAKSIPNMFHAPFQEWDDEDAAQHAYNLAQWRAKILEAKLLQARLHQKLLGASEQPPPSPPPPSPTPHRGRRSGSRGGRASGASRGRSGDEGGSRRELVREMMEMRKQDRLRLGNVQEQVLSLAKETTAALNTLSGKIRCLVSGGCASAAKPVKKRAAYATQGELAQVESRVGTEYRDLVRRLRSRGGRGEVERGEGGALGSVASQEKLWEKISGHA